MCVWWGGYAQETATLTFTKACNGKGIDDKKGEWTITSDAKESTFDTDKGIHYGTTKATVSYLKATSSSYSDKKITKIVVNSSAADSGSPKISCTVGGKAFGETQNLTTTNAVYSFSGEATGEIVVNISKNKTKKALYLLSIAVTFEDAAATTTTFGANSDKTFTFTNGTLEGFTTPTATAKKSDDNTDLSNLIEYTSSDADIVAVDSKTGELTFTNTKFGKATITATLPKTDTYQTSTDSYIVENKDNHITTSLSFNGTDITLTEGKTDAGADFTGYTATEANNIDGTITYAASGDAVATVDPTTGAVTINPSVYGTTTITATFTPADPTQYSGSTAKYQITNKKGKTYYTTLAAMKEAVPTTATNNAPVTLSLNLTDAIVTSVVGKKAAIQDATAGILVYGNNAFDLVKGKKYTGKVDVKAGWFNGYVEIVDWTPSADIVVEDAAELPLETITLAQFKANPDKYEFKRVKVSKVTTTTAYSTAKKATITQDGTDATLFGEATGLSMSINTIYDLIGCAYHHKTSSLDEYRIGIFAQEDITEIVKETPALSFAEATVTKELTAGTIDLQTITKPEDLDPSAITYASSDNETAEVYEGQILMYKTGEVTITATSAATDKYAAGTASYKLVIEDNRATDADFKFAAESYSADLAEATDGIVTFNAANVLQNPNNLKVTYTISPKDENVEIDASTGYIVISKRGIYTITATGDATNTYKKTTTTCTLKVINSAVEETSIEFVAGVDKGTQTGTGNEDQIVQDVVTIHGTDAAFAAVSSNKYTYRLYQNCTTTISTKIGKITKIEFVKGDKPINNLKYNGKDGAFTADTKYDLCWVGSAKEVVFTNSSQARATKIIVTVEVPKAKNYTLDETKTDNVIETYENANVTLQRTLEASHWNSFCVPFALDRDQVTQYFGEGTQLRTYEGRCENNIVYFATVDNIEAGKPYIMKPGNAVVKNPTFEGVSMVATGLDENGNPQAVGDASTVQMKGIYNHVTLVQDKTNIYIGAGNKFYYPADAEACQMNGLRAYFIVPEGTDIKKLRANLDGATTSLGEIFDTEESNTPVYNLQGQCVGNSLSTLKSGIYVQNGKKVVVK